MSGFPLAFNQQSIVRINETIQVINKKKKKKQLFNQIINPVDNSLNSAFI